VPVVFCMQKLPVDTFHSNRHCFVNVDLELQLGLLILMPEYPGINLILVLVAYPNWVWCHLPAFSLCRDFPSRPTTSLTEQPAAIVKFCAFTDPTAATTDGAPNFLLFPSSSLLSSPHLLRSFLEFVHLEGGSASRKPLCRSFLGSID
jgi:hypothetical protein